MTHRFNTTGKSAVKALLAAASIAPLLAFAGCANHSNNHFTVGSTASTYKERHPIIIDEKEQVLDIPVAPSADTLPGPSISAVQGYAQNYSRSSSGLITVLTPSGSANASAASHMANRVIEVLMDRGVPRSRIRTASYDASRHGRTAPIRLSFGAVKASVKRCGEWPDDLARSPENKQWHNFGCASQNNMAAQISNPADLLNPRGMTSSDAARRATVIDDYRENGSTDLSPTGDVYGTN